MSRALVVSATTRVIHKPDCPHATWIRHGLCLALKCIPASQRPYLRRCEHCKP